uniref:Uncharacterized protein n=1 Tax=Opuntia streptacantha TaxID=393608 RepID=A0A7C9A541_OPUST
MYVLVRKQAPTFGYGALSFASSLRRQHRVKLLIHLEYILQTSAAIPFGGSSHRCLPSWNVTCPVKQTYTAFFSPPQDTPQLLDLGPSAVSWFEQRQSQPTFELEHTC